MNKLSPELLRRLGAEEVTVASVLSRAVKEVLPDADGLAIRMLERPITLYLGIDPTSPDLHLGHAVPLRKLAEFQQLGNKVFLLFGTFTARIGDPTDKNATRRKLSADDVNRNVATYIDQASKILDLSPDAANPVKIVYNEEWLGKMSFEEVVELAANFTVPQMLERSMFKDRLSSGKPLYLHEILYPLMQGYDSVALGVDLEVGGSDQTFNMLVGRDLVRKLNNREKWVMALRLIEDPNGRKMGKTEGNIVNVNDSPAWKYEALMTWPDTAVPLGFELLTGVPMVQIEDMRNLLKEGRVDPLSLKRALAYRVVAELDGASLAERSEVEFDRVHKYGEIPSEIVSVRVSPDLDIYQMLLEVGLSRTEVDARQLVQQRSIYVNGRSVRANFNSWETGQVMSIGKKMIKNYRRIVVS